MRHLIILAVVLAINLCLVVQVPAQDIEETDSKNAELNALLDADSSTGVHDNQSGREARQFGFPFFGLPFFGGGFGRPFYGGGGGFYRRRRFYGGGFRRRRFYGGGFRRGRFFG